MKLETRTHLALWKTHKISLASPPEDTLHSMLFLEAGCHWDFEWPIKKKSQNCLERKSAPHQNDLTFREDLHFQKHNGHWTSLMCTS